MVLLINILLGCEKMNEDAISVVPNTYLKWCIVKGS